MATGLSIYGFVDKLGGLEEFVKFVRAIGRGEPMCKLSRAKGLDPAYVSRMLKACIQWEPKLKPAARDAVLLLIAEHKEFYDDARRSLTCEENLAQIIPVDFRGTRPGGRRGPAPGAP